MGRERGLILLLAAPSWMLIFLTAWEFAYN
jgi:hypothetical protein